jgi:hypothetical protein
MSRLSPGYEPRFDMDEADGHQGELFVEWAMKAILTGASVEIKTDRKSWTTGNLYIEQQCRVSGQWVGSGIDDGHTKSAIWAHLVVGPTVLFAPTAFVRYVAERHGRPLECREGSNPTRGKVLPIGQFVDLLAQLGRKWADDGGRSSLGAGADRDAPFGRKADGSPVAPYRFNRDGSVRLQPGGRRAGRARPAGLWPDAESAEST